ncbi:sensor histidine kinase [Acidipropionibacterium virtanenii]|uniref:sensor histidine kinase n=1 Tax=Acidipropionibacterium virtanenii TaxID=2057246 RepID=UPI0015F03D88|nr:histidine kinase [Acidipropionibacterium virtanenii]
MRAKQAWGDGSSSRAPAADTPFGGWLHRHALVIDIVVAVALFLYDSMYLAGQYAGFGSLSMPAFIVMEVVSAAICTLYVVRRRWPLTAAVLVFVFSCGYIVTDLGPAPVPLVALDLMAYFLAAQRGWRFGLLAAAVASVWIVVAAEPILQREYLRVGEVGVLVLATFFAATIGMATRARRRHVEGLRELNEQLARERDARAQVAAAEERARIAREIHDVVSHSLGTMVVMADGATRTVESNAEQAGAAMARVRDTGREAMAEMRRMLDVLRSDDPAMRAPQPGLGRLDRLIGEARASGLRVDLQVTGTPVALPSGIDLAAYRIVQESLTNARKHGGPLLSLVTVTVRYLDESVELRIVDDGREPVMSGAEPGNPGHGLVGMRERATAYGGTLETGLRASGGFEVRAVLPIGGTV